ncbi:hypothetical protein ACWF94_34055 [Streptomyces sp. NPDC055078]
MSNPAAWRAPDGTHWREFGPVAEEPDTVVLYRREQDPDTRAWRSLTLKSVDRRTVTEAEFSTYTPVAPEPLKDPRITHLATLVDALLTDYEDATGDPAPGTEEIREALAAVAAIPEEARTRSAGSRSAAYRSGYHQGRRRR